MRTIGLMSGTSLDGVDAAWLETDGERVDSFGPTLTLAYDDRLRADLRRILDVAPTLAPDDRRLKSAEARLTEYHIRAVAALGRQADLIGFHGQTILHQPDRQRTWQIGNPAELAWRTGVPVAFDFRSADVAAGGQGAPLAPIYHAALARDVAKPLAVVNIGGVSNVTWIGSDGTLIAFDTGPGNGPLDDWIARRVGSTFDRDGVVARSGTVAQPVLDRLLSHAYFAKPPPKSLDRLDFAAALAASGLEELSPPDGAATLVAFTAGAIAAAPLPAAPRRWLVTGGGRRNPAIMDVLRARLGAAVDPVEAVGWDGDVLEAQCFGFLAARTRAGLPISFPGTTGVQQPMPGGRMTMPDRA
ncbi:MAG TPA: anhydro-N-acetylmuramic acid kinase [Acetobacteraceae bacterium]|nr:anhydro-N-acetylmuramic acid kinase [Acetobacteraceae bacterium]